ncbi:MAG: hypothetical protein CAPSK01_001049 [Candidatus Accumulibacter vicinus]|uniref:Uncharacterized protein n=1 Tax=Candidatus Accumulibacter vicinus TaxID=2954382 RepID=A0A084Y3K9_9PROT|nr:MAG: hypothetical protein CAPSK01_001049 [Candidatus Accumulibacter vicinus]
MIIEWQEAGLGQRTAGDRRAVPGMIEPTVYRHQREQVKQAEWQGQLPAPGLEMEIMEGNPVLPETSAAIHADGAGQQRGALAGARKNEELRRFDGQPQDDAIEHGMTGCRTLSGEVPAAEHEAQGKDGKHLGR